MNNNRTAEIVGAGRAAASPAEHLRSCALVLGPRFLKIRFYSEEILVPAVIAVTATDSVSVERRSAPSGQCANRRAMPAADERAEPGAIARADQRRQFIAVFLPESAVVVAVVSR